MLHPNASQTDWCHKTTKALRWIALWRRIILINIQQLQHQPHPHDDVRQILLFVRCSLIFIRFIEIPFKCRRRSSSSCYILLMITTTTIIINNQTTFAVVFVFDLFLLPPDRMDMAARGAGTRIWTMGWGIATVSPFLEPSWAAAIYLIASSFCAPHFVWAPDLKSKFMFAIKTRSPVRLGVIINKKQQNKEDQIRNAECKTKTGPEMWP